MISVSELGAVEKSAVVAALIDADSILPYSTAGFIAVLAQLADLHASRLTPT